MNNSPTEAVRQLTRLLDRRHAAILQLSGLFLVVGGARLWLIDLFGSALPILDQWDAEAASVLAPWRNGTLRLENFFRPHNEHRLVLTRVLALAQSWLNGQWDARLEMTTNALLFAVMTVVIAAALIALFGAQLRGVIICGMTAWGACPFAEENTLWGMQSCFYLLFFFSVLTMWAFVLHRTGSVRWWIGVLGVILAGFSMASGFVVVLPVATIFLVRWIRRQASGRETAVILVIAAAAVFVTFKFRIVVPGHDVLKATSVGAWLSTVGRSLAWPFCNHAWAAVFTFFPLGLLTARYLFRAEITREQRKTETLLVAGGWVAAQAALIGFTRGGDGLLPIAHRYMDILGFAAVVNAIASVLLLQGLPATAPRRTAWCGAAIAWMLIMLAGIAQLSLQTMSTLGGRKPFLLEAEANVRAYVATGDIHFLDNTPQRAIPYPFARRLADLLKDPAIRELLPAAVREPLHVEPEGDHCGPFVRDGYSPETPNAPYEAAWGSYSAEPQEVNDSLISESISPKLPYLEFEIAGRLGRGMTLHVRSDKTDESIRFRPDRDAAAAWRPGYIREPATPLRIIARDGNRDYWFAFREPREVGRWSYYAAVGVPYGRGLLVAGLIIWIALSISSPLVGMATPHSLSAASPLSGGGT